MAEITLAATQTACDWDRAANISRVEDLVREAAAAGANVILPQELFETPYFCKDQQQSLFELAHAAEDHPVISRFSDLAKELGVVIPVSFFERANTAYYNSVAIVDADGSILGIYRKSHIPDGPGYQEKYYFNPGDTGFRVFKTRFGVIGCAICWDQWFPESARAMALMGAEILLYPTAIGSEPQDPTINSRDHWTRVMQGHAGANMMPLVASNRIGTEQGSDCSLTFYGSSFIAGPQGELLAQASRDRAEVITARVDLEDIRRNRASWGVFRDRRPDLYGPLSTLDGRTIHPAANRTG
jgi:N-carbamoylputrescine amidase